MVLVCYDVDMTGKDGARRLRRVAKACEDFGQRVQHSVFECLVDPAQFTVLKHRLEKEILLVKDSVRFYFLGKNWRKRVEHIGAKKPYDPQGPIIV